MTIYEFMDCFEDKDYQKVQVYDCSTDECAFMGDYADMPESVDELELSTVDNVDKDCGGVIVINIYSED